MRRLLRGQMRRTMSSNVTKVRVGCKIRRGAQDEVVGVGEAFSCSLEPDRKKNMN